MKIKSYICVVLGVGFFVLSPLTLAETPADAELLEEVPPPPPVESGEVLESEPQVTIRKGKEKTVHEYRMHGELYMMKVIPDHGVPYYLYKDDQQSDWVNVGPNPPLSIPKWTLFTF